MAAGALVSAFFAASPVLPPVPVEESLELVLELESVELLLSLEDDEEVLAAAFDPRLSVL